MKRNSILLTASIFLLTLLVSVVCQAQVFSDYDGKVDFTKYKTYAWIAPGDSIFNRHRPDKVFGGFIMHTVNQELKSKGLVVDTVQPSAILMFHTKVEDRTKYTQGPTLSVGVGVAGPGYYAGGMAPVAGGEIKESYYQNGALAFEMFDAKTGHLIWTGGDKKDFTNSVDIQKMITTSVKKIFKKLPIKTKKKK
ncbi:MAG TPA: DUF4136 domain-containing protein [Cyclobacteriaceae bacterium]|nr:DUF4136 domain-containing protein [Cyclobacteriaceae bacterium]